jgi:hypothetical protein
MPKPCMTCTQNMSRNAKVKKTGTKVRRGGGMNGNMPKTCMTCTQDMSRNNGHMVMLAGLRELLNFFCTTQELAARHFEMPTSEAPGKN